MNQKLAILIINPDESSTLALKTILSEVKGVSVDGEATDLLDGFQQIKKLNPDVIVLSLYPSEEQSLKIAEKISHTYPDRTLFVTSPQARPDLIIRAMRSGAREFWLQPFRLEELANGIQIALRLKKQSEPQGTVAKMITVFGVKGGVGATTIATNLAVSTAQRTQKEVMLLDANFQLGQAELFLNLKPKYSVLDVINNFNSIEPSMLKSALSKMAAEVYFLGGPANIEEAEEIKAVHVEQMVTLLRGLFDYIIVDTHPVFDKFNIRLLDESDLVLVVATFDVPSIHNARRCLDLFRRLEYGKDKVLLVINRYVENDLMNLDTLQKSIGYPVFWRIPNQDYTSVVRSINEGSPLCQSMPKSRLSRNLYEMMDQLNGTFDLKPSEIEAKNKSNLFRKLISPRGE